MPVSKKLSVLRRSTEIAAILKEGRSFSNQYFVLVIRKDGTGQAGYALIASKKIGGAVQRNRCRRRMRSRVDFLSSQIEVNMSFVLIARAGLLTVDSKTLDKTFYQQFVKAGLILEHE